MKIKRGAAFALIKRRTGAGKHDSRPNRQRTRAGAKRAAIKEAS